MWLNHGVQTIPSGLSLSLHDSALLSLTLAVFCQVFFKWRPLPSTGLVCKFGSHHGNTETSFFPFPSKSQKQASLALISPAWVMCPLLKQSLPRRICYCHWLVFNGSLINRQGSKSLGNLRFTNNPHLSKGNDSQHTHNTQASLADWAVFQSLFSSR